jgi:uncharacterized damage-inducible protein DinB
MKEILANLAAYNLWANEKVTTALATLCADSWQKPLGGSFPTVHHTLLHIWDAESIWWQRMKLQENVIRPSTAAPVPQEAIAGLLKQSAQWAEWVQAATEAALQHEFIFQNAKRESLKNTTAEMLIHVFNHGTYHRGQLINYLRLLGVTAVPSTDFIAFTRKK